MSLRPALFRRIPTLCRGYAYKPKQSFALKNTAPVQEIVSTKVDATPYHALLTRLGVDFTLPDATAIQIFTHKSHRHGIEGYNEKLAFLGRRVLELRVSEYLITRPSSSPSAIAGRDVDRILGTRIKDVSASSRSGSFLLSQFPELKQLLRWKPRDEQDRTGSGQIKVAAESLMALIGAIELQAGGSHAKQFVEKTVIPGLRIFEDVERTTTTTTPTTAGR